MRLRFFLLGVLVGMLCASGRGRETVRRLRDRLAATIDALLRIGVPGAANERGTAAERRVLTRL